MTTRELALTLSRAAWFVIPGAVCAVYIAAPAAPWGPLMSVVVLASVGVACETVGDRRTAEFAALCGLIMLPMGVGAHTMTPALGAALLVLAHVMVPSWRDGRESLFRVRLSVRVVVAVAVVSVGVAVFQAVWASTRVSASSLQWQTLPGQDLGIVWVAGIVIGASLVNSAFEELLWREGMSRLFRGRRLLLLQWVFISALFGLSHVQGTPGGLLGTVFAGLFGFAMCLVRELALGDVVWIILAHFIADVILIGGVYGLFIR